jgi:hypothetical protein
MCSINVSSATRLFGINHKFISKQKSALRHLGCQDYCQRQKHLFQNESLHIIFPLFKNVNVKAFVIHSNLKHVQYERTQREYENYSAQEMATAKQ